MNTLQWQQSEDGYTQTHCGTFMIEPQWIGTSKRPNYFELWRHDWYYARQIRIAGRFATQRDAKAKAQELANKSK